MYKKGEQSAPLKYNSEDHGKQSITFANCGRFDKPEVASARFRVNRSSKDSLILHLYQHRMNCALVILRIETHFTGEVRQILCPVSDENATGKDANGEGDDLGEVRGHGLSVVDSGIVDEVGGFCNPP